MEEMLKRIMAQVVNEMIPVHKFLGITLRDVRPGWVQLYLPYRQELEGDPRSNRMHGGIIACLLDSAGGAAAVTTLSGPEDMLSSIDIRVDYLEPAKPDHVVAEGEIVRSGSAIIVTRMKAYHETSGEVIAEGKAVYRVKRLGDSLITERAKGDPED
jgi:uncharacterized protein (TIGR00369 family)